ncbi:MAG: class I adenylate-forming enzyme family protein [Rhodospirillales bacterium]
MLHGIPNWARATPDRLALRALDQDATLTWAELDDLTARVAAFLRARGIGPGDRVAVVVDNALEGVVLFYGVLRAGATFVAVAAESAPASAREMVARVAPKLVLVPAGGAHGDVGADAPTLAFCRWSADPAQAAADAVFAALPPPGAGDPHVASPGPDDIAAIGFTSGTTGTPKGVMHSYRSFAAMGRHYVETWGLTERDRLLEYRSFAWVSAQAMALAPLVLAGCEVSVARRFSQSRFFDWVGTVRPTIVIGVPTVVNLLLERSADATAGDLAGVRFVTCSTAPLLAEQHRRFEATYAVPLVQHYGTSEGGVVAANPPAARRIGSVGRPGVAQVVRVVAPDGGPLPAGETGEVEVAGAQLAFGYLEADRSVTPLQGRAMRTGDLGHFDADGYLHLTGRSKDIIIRGGLNVAPVEVDGVLAADPSVAEAATVGVPDPIYGEEIVSFVVAAPGRQADPAALLAACAAALPAGRRPRAVRVVAAIPRTDRGKTDRAALRALWEAGI